MRLQMGMLMEECAELIKETNKVMRKHSNQTFVDVVFRKRVKNNSKVLVACRIQRETKLFIKKNNINLALLVEKAVEELKEKEK